MKISTSWLRELLATDATDGEIAARLTAAGLEVEGEEQVGAGLSGVIVAEVRDRRKHPKADKLTLVDVWDGREVTQVVCGAPNVPAPGGLGPGAQRGAQSAASNKVAWARPGATLLSGITMAAKEVRGVLSPGMLCAEDELGLGESHEGILILDADATPGADVGALLGLPDRILELNVTPNRPDCMGHLGVAREVAALCPGARLLPVPRALDPVRGEAIAPPAVAIEDREGCPRYTANVLAGVTVGQSPLKVRLLLGRLGVRAINDVVDATNLALMLTGQPLHAFDLDKLRGPAIVVRRPRAGERIVTLDGQDRALAVDDVVICDAERPVALAGVMGGLDTEVTATTTRILLESAAFDPARIRRTARRVGLHSEASQRFERGVDPNAGVTLASDACARWIAQWTGAKVALPSLVDCYPRPIAPRELALRPARTERVTGMALPAAEQARILRALGIEVREEGALLRCSVPTFRPDLTREIDLVEEIARVHGYDEVPATLPRSTMAPVPPDRAGLAAESVRDALAALGLAETVSFAFVAPERIAALGYSDGRAAPLRLENPLREEQSVMRTSLVPGLLAALARNQSRGVWDVRLFELGTVFLPSENMLPCERLVAAGVIAGRRDGWLKPGEELDYFDAKGVVEGLLARRRVAATSFRAPRAGEAPWLHPGLAAVVSVGGAEAGVVGEVHPELRDRFGVEGRAFAFELSLAAIEAAEPPALVELPRFPGSARDLSFFVDAAVPAADLGAAMAAASPLIESVRVLEDYREPGKVPAGRKGMLFALGFRSRERTLTDDEVNAAHSTVIEALRTCFQIEQR